MTSLFGRRYLIVVALLAANLAVLVGIAWGMGSNRRHEDGRFGQVERLISDAPPFFVAAGDGRIGYVIKVTPSGYVSVEAIGRNGVREVYHSWRELMQRSRQ